MKVFKVLKILTHNILIGENQGKEYMLIGKGIGFQKKPGMLVSEEQTSNYYIIQDAKKISDYEKVVLDTPDQTLLATEKAILYAEEKLNVKFDESIHLSLLDHINFAIYRLEHQLQVGSFLTEEYYVMYSELYELAVEMVKMINQTIGVTLPSSEVGAIILHLHAAINQEKVSQTATNAQVIEYSLNFIQEKLGVEFAGNQLAKARLITHLKFALKRSKDQKVLQNPLVEVIKEKYPVVYQVAKELADTIVSTFGIEFSESEISYIALHLYNLQL